MMQVQGMLSVAPQGVVGLVEHVGHGQKLLVGCNSFNLTGFSQVFVCAEAKCFRISVSVCNKRTSGPS